MVGVPALFLDLSNFQVEKRKQYLSLSSSCRFLADLSFFYSGAPVPGHSQGVDTHHMFRKGKLSGCFTVLDNPEHLVTVADVPGPASAAAAAAFYLLSDDFDATLKKVVEHGAKVKE
jgi:hypothetical protein